MRITKLTPQQRDKNRINVFVDGVYSFSLDVSQVIDLGVRTDIDYSEDQIKAIVVESEYGKLYSRALEYSLMRPHSQYELEQYLYKKTRPSRLKDGSLRMGYSEDSAKRVLDAILAKGYVDDAKFAEYWVNNRRLGKGASMRLIRSELQAKGVSGLTIEAAINSSDRDDRTELRKVIEKKSRRYSDKSKFQQYLVRQGFSYGDVVDELSAWEG